MPLTDARPLSDEVGNASGKLVDGDGVDGMVVGSNASGGGGGAGGVGGRLGLVAE